MALKKRGVETRPAKVVKDVETRVIDEDELRTVARRGHEPSNPELADKDQPEEDAGNAEPSAGRRH